MDKQLYFLVDTSDNNFVICICNDYMSCYHILEKYNFEKYNKYYYPDSIYKIIEPKTGYIKKGC